MQDSSYNSISDKHHFFFKYNYVPKIACQLHSLFSSFVNLQDKLRVFWRGHTQRTALGSLGPEPKPQAQQPESHLIISHSHIPPGPREPLDGYTDSDSISHAWVLAHSFC